jgi:hypothetical protein
MYIPTLNLFFLRNLRLSPVTFFSQTVESNERTSPSRPVDTCTAVPKHYAVGHTSLDFIPVAR